MTTAPARQPPAQFRSLVRASHPRQALAFAAVVGLLVGLTRDDPAREVAISAAAVLLAQLIMGLVNDLFDVDIDRRSGATGKPVADRILPPGNVSFAIAILLLLVIPLSLQNGIVAGVFLLSTLAVGFVHNRWLHTMFLSWAGWSATFALLTYFVTYGGWASEADGSEPFASFVVLSAVLGFFVHFLTSLPDLVVDKQAGVRHLPLRVALHTGAPRLLVVTLVATIVTIAALVYTTALNAAIAR
jgi:4-hydroxybenzoate polyprenyltransferase